MSEPTNFQHDEPAQIQKKFTTIILSAICITALVVGGSVYIWQRTILKFTENSFQEQINVLQKQLADANISQPVNLKSTAQAQEPLIRNIDDNHKVILKQNSQDNTKTDITIKSLKSDTEIFFISIPDVNTQHYHNIEYQNGNLYVIRRIGYDGYPDETWTDELWRYDTQKKGRKLYSDKGIDFRASPNDKHIAVGYDKLHIIDQDGAVLRTYTVTDLGFNGNQDLASGYELSDLAIGLMKWSSDGTQFWGDLFFTAFPQIFYTININSWTVDKYDISNLGIGDYDLNGDSGKIAFSNYPVLFDVDSAEEYKKSGAKVNLQVYNLKTKKLQQVATSITKMFAPKWIDENALEYNDPNSDSRIRKVIE